MRSIRQLVGAAAIALVSIGLVIGGLSLSQVEFSNPARSVSTDTPIPSPLPITATWTFPPPLIPPTPSFTSLPTNTQLPPPSCQIPSGWFAIVVQAGDTLETLALRYRMTAYELRTANCLLTDNVVQGATIYVPYIPTSTTVACAPGAVGWVKSYVVQPKDTFYHIATMHYTTASLLKQVNCRASDLLYVGETLWVPNVATRTSTPSVPTFTLPPNVKTFTPYPTDPLTQTALPFTRTPPPTSTFAPPTSTPSATLTPTASATPLPTLTPSITAFPP